MNIVGPTGCTKFPDLGDGALTVMEDVEPYIDWINSPDEDEQKVVLPTSDNLLEKETRQKIVLLFSEGGQGLDVIVYINVFPPIRQEIWHASEFLVEHILRFGTWG